MSGWCGPMQRWWYSPRSWLSILQRQNQCSPPVQVPWRRRSLQTIFACGRLWPNALFSDSDDTGTFIVPALTVRSRVLNIEDRRNGVGKPVFKLRTTTSSDSEKFMGKMTLSLYSGICPTIPAFWRFFSEQCERKLDQLFAFIRISRLMMHW